MALQDVLVPDIGDFKDVPVIAVLVKPGDTVKAEDGLVTLESDKASFDVPAPVAGVVKELALKVGDKVSEGTLVARIETAGEATDGREQADDAKARGGKAGGAPERAATPERPASPEQPVAASRGGEAPSEIAQPGKAFDDAATGAKPPPPQAGAKHAETHGGELAAVDEEAFSKVHAGPGVRKLARELGVELGRVQATGPKGRILPEDLHNFVKAAMAGGGGGAAAGAGGGLSVAPWPKVDFAKFGPIERQPLTRIQKIAGPGLHRNWVTIPHVTSCEDADVTDLEEFRKSLNAEQKDGVKVTMLAFLVKACISALQKFPAFNSSLEGDQIVLKRYYNIAFAADTPQGLIVPVIKDADKKGIWAIAKETADLAAKARDGKLMPGDISGATFTISSLGGIGGTYFTPIVNAPEVAILGVCRAAMRPVWNGQTFAPRLILPLSLSWDHRVVDGAAAARFNAHLASVLGDARRMLL
jgi:pyruvate dehydrogenase E2 component (dihydrolipoamide acetyltransferase)